MSNKGRAIEERVVQYVSDYAGKQISFKFSDNSVRTFDVAERIHSGGFTTRNKWDIVINPAVRVQVKSTSSNRASVVNMVPVRNLLKMAERELVDVQPALELFYELLETGKSIKLSDHSDIDDWYDMLTYLLFEGTPTAQEVPSMQANYLLEVSDNGYMMVEKSDAIDYIWNNLTASIRYRKNKTEPCLHIRYGK